MRHATENFEKLSRVDNFLNTTIIKM